MVGQYGSVTRSFEIDPCPFLPHTFSNQVNILARATPPVEIVTLLNSFLKKAHLSNSYISRHYSIKPWKLETHVKSKK